MLLNTTVFTRYICYICLTSSVVSLFIQSLRRWKYYKYFISTKIILLWFSGIALCCQIYECQKSPLFANTDSVATAHIYWKSLLCTMNLRRDHKDSKHEFRNNIMPAAFQKFGDRVRLNNEHRKCWLKRKESLPLHE